MSDGPPRVPRHEAADRAGKAALRAAHDLGAALAGEDADAEPVVLRRGGPHRSLDALAARLDAALAEDDRVRTQEEDAARAEEQAFPAEEEAVEPRPGPHDAGETRGAASPGRREDRP